MRMVSGAGRMLGDLEKRPEAPGDRADSLLCAQILWSYVNKVLAPDDLSPFDR